MGLDVEKQYNNLAVQTKVFAGSRGGFFKKSPWPPEARK
jgi:hypothetical protein